MKNKILKIAVSICLVSTLVNTAFASVLHKIQARASSYQDATYSLSLETSNNNQQTLVLNTEKVFSVHLVANLPTVSGINVTWQITGNSNSQNASLVVNGTPGSTQTVVATDANGNASVTVQTGQIAAVYTLTARATVTLPDSTSHDLEQTFNLVSGVQASVQISTPENQIATSLDNLCPQLQQANVANLSTQQQALLAHCNEIQQAASEGKTLEVGQVLRQISPEEVATQSRISSNFVSQQISNISSRLGAIRRGSFKTSFSQLGFNYKGQNIPIGYLLNSIFNANDSKKIETGSLLDNRLGLFANGNTSIGSRSSTTREDGFNFDSYGITLGADYRLRSTSFLGAALGLSNSGVNILDNGGNLNSTGLSMNIYGTHYLNEQYYLDAIINLGQNTYKMDRNINYTLGSNPGIRTANSNTKGIQKSLTVGGGYDTHDGALSMNLTGRLTYTQLDIDNFTESGAQELDLHINHQVIHNVISSLGGQLSYTHSTKFGVLIPFIGLSWRHEFHGQADTISGYFAEDQINSGFNIKTETYDSNYFSNVEGISMVLPHGISAYIRMANILGKDYYSITNISLGGRMELSSL